MTEAETRGADRWEKSCLLLLAVGSTVSGLITSIGGLGMMMILGDLLQGRGSSLLGWGLVGIYASQIIAVLLGWIAFAFDRHRLATTLASWPILLGLFILMGLMLLPR